MKNFQDTKTGEIWSFMDDVNVIDQGGVLSFESASGIPLQVPATLQPYVEQPPTIAQQWAAYQSACLNELNRIASTMQRIALAVSLGSVAATDPVVQQWVAYQKNLRAQLSAAQPATIPAMPQIPIDSTGKVIYPANT